LPGDCLIEPGLSRTFKRQLKELLKKYRHAETDLAEAYAQIIKDRKRACNALDVPGYGSKIWKYRCDSVDMERGQSGGFRIMALWKEEENTLYPFCIYTHIQYPKQPPVKDLRKWLKEVLGVGPSEPPANTVLVEACIICGTTLSGEEQDAFGDRCARHRVS
jgi:mRNA-degrading endonuclease RelE of RelBE toxin-antitoxin system